VFTQRFVIVYHVEMQLSRYQ